MLFATVLTIGSTYAATPNGKIEEATRMADELKDLGLFNGTSNGYELERAGTRAEALIMLIRLLGEKRVAEESRYDHPFTDVPDWADTYVAYGYNKAYTSGISESKFGSTDKVTANQYITLVLRALGYSEETDGYSWDNPFDFAEKIGLIKKGEYSKDSEFIRADIVILSYRALDIQYNNQTTTLREKYFSGGFVNTEGKGDPRNAGVFRNPDSKLVTVNKDADYRTNLNRLNEMIFYTYGFTYVPDLSKYGTDWSTCRIEYDSNTNRYGIEIYQWRKSYDSGTHINNALNAVLETFYFFTGDKQVSYALWSFVDTASINGYANTDDFGFRDTATFENGFSAIMNGIEVDVINGDGTITFYFK